MCGIVGYVGVREATEVILSGLQRLEYRGYDSAGIAVYGEEGLHMRRSVGKLGALVAHVRERPVFGHCGIGHTRWATHGAVTEDNTHPHHDQRGEIVVIQNGIVENYLELKGRLIEQGHHFRSQTDTEVIAHLVGVHFDACGSLEGAVRRTLTELRGGNAIVAFSVREPERLVAARRGNAGGVVVGLGEGETFVASDLPAILDYTRRVLFLEDGELAVIERDGVRIVASDGGTVARKATAVSWDPVAAAKGDYKHFMQKEIAEQPRALTDMLRGRIDLEAGRVELEDVRLGDDDLRQLDQIIAVGCGTAWHAALAGKFIVEALARVRVEVDYASEFRYRAPILRQETGGKRQDSLLVAVTQSGETVDTLAAMELARREGVPSVALVNAVGSQAARVADGGAIYLHAGPEIGVASTKAFTTMLVGWYLFALRLAQARRTLSTAEIRSHLQGLIELPGHVAHVLDTAAPICGRLAERYHGATNALYLGRQINYPIALEGALKLKEISYIHAEGYPAGEMKHGPVALIDEHLPVVCIAVRDSVYEKMLSNVEQVRARGGDVIAIATVGDDAIATQASHVISIPAVAPLLAPVLTVLPLQLLAYHIAVHRGCDVDQPRNLAKSVTVE